MGDKRNLLTGDPPQALQMTGRQAVTRGKMTIRGDVDPPSLLPWIRRHAAKLGLAQSVTQSGPDRIDFQLAGPVELIDMMEMGCSLGPIDVWVEAIEREPIGGEAG